jgi:phosphoenolpyruvate synthase/pyruvate phosphate dikinase
MGQTYVVPLSDAGRAEVMGVGHKAANLGELRRAGFRNRVRLHV